MNASKQFTARADWEIMLQRTKAHARGGTPLMIQRNVESLETWEYPIQVRSGATLWNSKQKDTL